MQKILFDFYNGHIHPSEGTYPKGEEYKKAVKQVCSLENSLLSQLDEVGKELYRQLTSAIAARDNIEAAQIFADTFRLGANIILACFWENEDE